MAVAQPRLTQNATVHAWLCERLLALVSEIPIESGNLKSEEFRAELNRLRSRIAANDEDGASRQAAEDCLALCRDFAERACVHFLERETEFKQAVAVLHKALVELSGKNDEFRDRLEHSSGRLIELSTLDDIRLLRQRLAAEVGELKKSIEEQKRLDEEHQRRMTVQVESLQTSLQQARVEASLDAMTGVANRRSFDAELARRVRERGNTEKPFVLAMLDLDNFKNLNDAHGHSAGDFVIRTTARFFSQNLRTEDFVARYGGEEFAIILSQITLEQAEPRLQRLIEKLAAGVYDYEAGGRTIQLSFTVSCGIAECGMTESAPDLLMRADEALYEAKRRGKNRVVTTW